AGGGLAGNISGVRGTRSGGASETFIATHRFTFDRLVIFKHNHPLEDSGKQVPHGPLGSPWGV
ncbi:MAG: hypothetical protein VXY76_05140, partial [Pseudomonadota bacterium]|nr:hypothetical protein [Pseudomonadota bacterium]